ncbi:unnamed protein product [Sphagnum balticum]
MPERRSCLKGSLWARWERRNEDEGRGGVGEGSYTSRKRRRARARALPHAAVAKPQGGQHHAAEYHTN